MILRVVPRNPLILPSPLPAPAQNLRRFVSVKDIAVLRMLRFLGSGLGAYGRTKDSINITQPTAMEDKECIYLTDLEVVERPNVI